MATYNHQEIEKKWQQKWDESQLYKTSETPKNKKYVLDMFPYPSGAGLHVGHPEGYTATDIFTRFLRMNGHDVLHPMGWDAFGLPAENYAIKMGIPPAETTAQNIIRFREQIKAIGLSYDWSREVNTSSPEYYRWTQWLFVQLYKKGLAYKKHANVNWCPSDHTVLANEQVVDGKCERCGTVVEQKMLSQWFFKITDYAESLLSGLETVDWPEPIRLMQKNWIGKSEGAEIEFPIFNEGIEVKHTLIIHGLNGSSNENWFPWLRKQLEKTGVNVQVPDLPDPNHPIVEDWNQALLKEVQPDSVIIGHSLGGPAALNLVQTFGQKISKLILVAPVNPDQEWSHLKETSDSDWDAVKTFADLKFDWKRISELVDQIIIYYSDDDKYIPERSIDFFKKNLPQAVFKFRPKSGHFSKSTSGLVEFPEVFNDIKPKIKVFTTRPDTLFGATYMVLAPEHPLLENFKVQISNIKEIEKYIEATKKKTELQRTALEKNKVGVELKGIKAINPATKEAIPVWIADYVLANYGTGAIMAVPAHDERDMEFAEKYSLPVRVVVDEEGKLVFSGQYNGLAWQEAKNKLGIDFGKLKVQYKLRDWLVSRQRYWGAPIPIVYCNICGEQPVPESELPVLLPTDVDFKPTGESPIARSKSFHNAKCPKCGKEAARDSDTMDTFVDSSWYYFRYTDPHNEKEFASKDKLKEWLPVDTYVGGAEHAVLHLLYARFFSKVLKDLGYVDFEEPFLKLRNQGLILGPDGEKMSKSKGNVINPDDVIKEFGADSLRLYEMFMGPLEDSKPWATTGIVGVRRFLDKVVRFQEGFTPSVEAKGIHKLVKKISSDIESFKFNTAIAAFMEFLNENKQMSKQNWETFLILLAPFAPHVTEELWATLGHTDSIHKQTWPQFDPTQVLEESVTVVVQVLGKMRGSVEIAAGSTEEIVKTQALKDANVAKYLEGKEVIKVIFVKDRLINFVTK